ncbi:MAG: SbcC/MukB-like Walker B domain-containing protein [Verrucomicrobiales bacterium]|nr:SbcC/MukB-like Walker B domain-containing protein [Verrucomicrobiales bacterium]
MMDDLFDVQGLPGYRLHKLEITNWGTFDSTDGSVYSVHPKGRTSLLVGKNGSGKSTLVDALLTLLVRPGLRSYNLAAGSTGRKRERNESSYIRGAFGHASSDSENKASTLYLRGDRKSASILLAYFENEDINRGFTVAQYLYLTDQNVERIYCFAKGEKSIREDFAEIKSTEKLISQLKKAGFDATKSFAQYHKKIVSETKMQGKAMDVFNQTVSVKDIQTLTGFIRDHMLERSSRKEQVAEILTHFDQLSQAHQLLVQARDQLSALEPVADAGERYQSLGAELIEKRNRLQASDVFFRQQSVEIWTEAREKWFDEHDGVNRTLQTVEEKIEAVEAKIRKLENDRDNAGGERLRLIPQEIKFHTREAEIKKQLYDSYRSHLKRAGITDAVPDETTFLKLREKLATVETDSNQRVREAGKRLIDNGVRRRDCIIERDQLEAEIRSLMQRKTKLPGQFDEMRARLCEDLKLDPAHFPFAAELIAVKDYEREWEAAAEMVLRNFGLSLLVPGEFYREVSSYVNRTRLSDRHGKGQRLVYLMVDEHHRLELNRPEQHSRSIWHKLEFKHDHPFADWVSIEVGRLHAYRCCDTIEDFQNASGQAITKERQIKRGSVRHEKDDRERVADPRNWVLGWNFESKLELLRQDYKDRVEELTKLDREITSLRQQEEKYRNLAHSAQRALEIKHFAGIDFESENQIISDLTHEKERLETEDDKVQAILEEIKAAQAEKKKHRAEERDLIGKLNDLDRDLNQAGQLISAAEEILAEANKAGTIARDSERFPDIIAELHASGDWPLTVENVVQKEGAYRKSLQSVVDRLHEDLRPLRDQVLKAMNRFLNEFRHMGHDHLIADPDQVEDFLAVRDQLITDDLPRYEKRFRERLVENVAQEIGIFRTKLDNAAAEIERKIELLNHCLAEIDYNENPGTVMKLEPLPVNDPEIREFRSDLRHCLDGYKAGTPEAMEECFANIQALIEKLSEEPTRWEKLIDVRRWYDFAAREQVRETGEEKGYFTDSMGQSGGEKAKLAFTILVAAVVYQFDIDKRSSTSQRFHFVMVDEMFSKVDDAYAEYAMRLFESFGLQLLIVAPFDAKAKITEPFVEYYLHVVKQDDHSQVFTMTATEFLESAEA